jgi:hypothetical protein
MAAIEAEAEEAQAVGERYGPNSAS